MKHIAPLLFIIWVVAFALTAHGEAQKQRPWPAYEGAWFTIRYPPGFTVKPSLRSQTAAEGYDSAFFRSPDKTVEFYVFSPQWSGEPTDIAVDRKKEKVISEKHEAKKGVKTHRVTIRAKDKSYWRSYTSVEHTEYNTRHVFGIKYRDRKAYARYRSAYVKFKKSLEQFAD